MIDAGGRYIIPREGLVDSVMLEAVRGQGYSESTKLLKYQNRCLRNVSKCSCTWFNVALSFSHRSTK